MNTDDKRRLYELLEPRYALFNRQMTNSLLEMWAGDLDGYSIEQIAAALKQAGRRLRFPPVPADVLNLLPCPLGHATPEIAWNIVPKTDLEGEFVTDEIMQAASTVLDAIKNRDKMARMGFLEAYKQILSSAQVQGKKAVWWFSAANNGSFEQRRHDKLKKTIAAAQCGRIDQKRAIELVRTISSELDLDSNAYLLKLPGVTKQHLRIENTSKPTKNLSNIISDATNLINKH